jgi:Nickel responsive protein SCO4226-like
MLYAAKCYWPDVSRSELEQVADRAAHSAGALAPREVAYLGSLMFAADDLVLCLFDGASRAAVKSASERLGIPCERVMESVWLGPSLTGQDEADS